MKTLRQIIFAVLVVIALLLGCMLIYLQICVRGHGGSLKRFELVEAGMSEQQVRGLMGSPDMTHEHSDGTHCLTYGRTYKHCTLQFRFSQDGQFLEKVHTHNN
jgi:outer membrane protein assembly factor BamE (lipoprotein component of BamABCDE complex)